MGDEPLGYLVFLQVCDELLGAAFREASKGPVSIRKVAIDKGHGFRQGRKVFRHLNTGSSPWRSR